MFNRRSLLGAAMSVVGAFVVSACHDSSSGPALPDSLVRVVHAVADAPRVNVFLNDDLVLENFDFRNSSGFVGIRPGRYDIRVEAIVPGGNIDVITANDVEFFSQEKTTIYATGNTGEGSIAPLLVPTPIDAVMPGMARASVVHAWPNVPTPSSTTVSVFVTAPGADITASAPLGTFDFGETLGPVQVPAGDYQIRVAAGSGPSFTDADVVYDAGTVTLPDGADVQIAAVTSTVAGTAPISLVVSDDAGGADLFDIGTPAEVRAVHNSPDAPAVDLIVNDDFANPVLTGVTFTQFSDFLEVPPASYNFKVVDTGTQTVEAINFDADLEAGIAYTVIANDFLANITELVLIDDNRRVATEAKLRLVHGSPSAGPVDIYLLPVGTLPSDAGVEPAYEDVTFGMETGFAGVPAGTYDVYVTPANDPTTLAIPAPNVPLSAGGVYTAIARDNTGGAGGAPLGLILLDDFTL